MARVLRLDYVRLKRRLMAEAGAAVTAGLQIDVLGLT